MVDRPVGVGHGVERGDGLGGLFRPAEVEVPAGQRPARRRPFRRDRIAQQVAQHRLGPLGMAAPQRLVEGGGPQRGVAAALGAPGGAVVLGRVLPRKADVLVRLVVPDRVEPRRQVLRRRLRAGIARRVVGGHIVGGAFDQEGSASTGPPARPSSRPNAR